MILGTFKKVIANGIHLGGWVGGWVGRQVKHKAFKYCFQISFDRLNLIANRHATYMIACIYGQGVL